MSEAYPLPSYGLSLWLTGDKLNIAIPPSPGTDKGHTITIPLAKCSIETSEGGQPLGRQRGWFVLLDLLKAKEREKRSPAAKLGERSAPVRYDIEKMLLAMGGAKKFDERGQRVLSYEDLFADDSEKAKP